MAKNNTQEAELAAKEQAEKEAQVAAQGVKEQVEKAAQAAVEQAGKEQVEKAAQAAVGQAAKEQIEKAAENELFAKKSAELFARYPHVLTLYFTADATGFFHENDAKNHAKTLKNNTVTKIKK